MGCAGLRGWGGSDDSGLERRKPPHTREPGLGNVLTSAVLSEE